MSAPPIRYEPGHLARLLGLHARPETTRRQLANFCYGLSHGILGNRVAAELHYPPTTWRYAAPALLRSPRRTWLLRARQRPGSGPPWRS